MDRRSLIKSALLAGALAGWGVSFADDYPSRLVKIVVPFLPGGLTDALARTLANSLQEKWGQTVVVENRSGASGSIGTEYVGRSAPDGYTLLLTPQQTIVIAKLVNPKLAFDPETLAPVSIMTKNTVALLVSPKVPVDNLQQFVAYAASKSGQLNYGSTGPGSSAQLTGELFSTMAKAKIVEVPYQGTAPAIVALMAGQIDMVFDSVSAALPYAQSGKLKILGVATEKRHPGLPDVPAITEALPGFSSPLWVAVAAPPNTPAAITTRISHDIADALKSPAFAKIVDSAPGLQLVGSSPSDMAELIATERDQWARVIKAADMKF